MILNTNNPLDTKTCHIFMFYSMQYFTTLIHNFKVRENIHPSIFLQVVHSLVGCRLPAMSTSLKLEKKQYSIKVSKMGREPRLLQTRAQESRAMSLATSLIGACCSDVLRLEQHPPPSLRSADLSTECAIKSP